jgi:hypothetical protein
MPVKLPAGQIAGLKGSSQPPNAKLPFENKLALPIG